MTRPLVWMLKSMFFGAISALLAAICIGKRDFLISIARFFRVLFDQSQGGAVSRLPLLKDSNAAFIDGSEEPSPVNLSCKKDIIPFSPSA